MTNAHIIRPFCAEPVTSFAAGDPPPVLKPFNQLRVRAEVSLVAVDTGVLETVPAAAAAAAGPSTVEHVLGASAEIVYMSPPPLDAALLRSSDPTVLSLPTAVFASSLPLTVGMRVFVAGYPIFGAMSGECDSGNHRLSSEPGAGLCASVTEGQLAKVAMSGGSPVLLQTTAVVNQGNRCRDRIPSSFPASR
jgi:hypothetical protein